MTKIEIPPAILVLPLMTWLCCTMVDRAAATPSSDRSPMTLQLETAYERLAVNYNLLIADTSSLSPDSLTRLQQTADTRTEPAAGVLFAWRPENFFLENDIYLAESGWREQGACRMRFDVSPSWSVRANGHFMYYGANRSADSLLIDYWTLAADARLLRKLTATHHLLWRVDGNRLHYPGSPPSFGYNYNRYRTRIGWQWAAENFDFAEFTAGVGERRVPDSTDREYNEWFVAGFCDIQVAEHRRVLVDLALNAKDYRAADSGDDYAVFSLSGRGEWGTAATRRFSIGLRFDYWNFVAPDEITFDFYELEPALEYRVSLADRWEVRLGSAYRRVAALETEYASGDYQQPSGIIGLAYPAQASLWFDVRGEVGWRNYHASSSGYSDFLFTRADISADLSLGDWLVLSAIVNYEKEYHRVAADDAEFLFFSLRLRYRLIQ